MGFFYWHEKDAVTMARRKPRHYSKETEAAWYAVSEFIDPMNCSTEYEGRAIQINYNEVLCHVLSKTRVFAPFTYSKAKYERHILQWEDHYYRSKPKARHRKGYGNSDKQAQALVFAEELGVQSKKSTYDHTYYIVLLAIDIDAHNDEKDAQRVADWLKTEYFHSSYWEPSTHFNGRHGYLKLAYPDHLPLSEVAAILENLFRLLDLKRKSLRFSSSIDHPCGLPAQFTWDNSIIVPSSLPRIESAHYAQYRELRDKIKAGKLSNSNIPITTFLSYEEIDEVVQIPLPCSMIQSQCIKLPRFNFTDPTKATMVDIISFSQLPFYSFDYFVKVRNDLRAEFPEALGESVKTDSPSEKENAVLPEPIPRDLREIVPNIVGGDGGRCSIVSSPKGEQNDARGSIEEVGRVRTHSLEDIKRERWTSKVTPHRMKTSEEEYIAAIDEVKKIANKAALTTSFYVHFSDYLGRIAEVDEAEDEYIRLGLNVTRGKGVRGRIRRLNDAKEFTEALWRTRKRGFNLTGWEERKLEVLESIFNRIESLDKTWVKDPRRGRIYDIHDEELALVYYAISKSNDMDEKRGRSNSMRYAFSYRQVQDCFRAVYRQTCHRAKARRVLAILVEAGLLEPVGSHLAGEHGKRYRAVRLKPDKTVDPPTGGAQQPSGGFT